MKTSLWLGAACALLSLAAAANADPIRDDWLSYDGGADQLPTSPDLGGGPLGAGGGGSVALGFQGVSQYNVAAFGRNFIPPDTMGAVGSSQFMETTNGAYAVFNKTTGARQSLVSDVAFWAAAGQTGANGDSRVMFNSTYNKWVVISFGASASDIQIAVSNTADATGGWKSVKFTGYSGVGYGGAVADYPTLSMDGKALYIGTNNYACNNATCSTGQTFHGTSMDVIPLSSIFGGGGPSTAGARQYNSYYQTPGKTTDLSHGFALQGVNGYTGADGKVVAVSAVSNQLETFNINNPLSSSGSYGAATFFGSTYDNVSAGREPGTYVDSNGVTQNYTVDALDDRVSSSVWDVHGMIYSVHTVGDGLGNDVVRITVTDAHTNAVLSETDIGQAGYDYFQGSIAVNKSGEVVIGYNRSGTASDGLVSFLTRTYKTLPNGTLQAMGGETLLQTSLTDSYHNGSLDGAAPAGRQRWGDYSEVTVDPNNPQNFWLIGEYAREFNDAANGHPGGTGGSRWSTWIAEINAPAVPEPATWAMMLIGVGLAGAALRRRRDAFATA